MKKQFAFGSLLLLTSQLVAPATLAQESTGTTAPTTPPSAQASDAAQEDPVDQDVEISAPGASDGSEDIVVVGRNIPNVVRATPQVISVLSTADIARTGEGDIAGALQRVTGLSVVGNGFVFVRGLGDRYSSSLLNGSPLPSPEPLRRVVPLDIFPTNVIASALVQKSYSSNYPGEFGGGAINLTTKAVPDETFIQIGGGVGFDTVTTSELGYVHDGGDHDTIGFDSGERELPGFIRRAGLGNLNVTNTADILTLTNAQTTLVESNFHIPANWSGELSFGSSADFGSTRVGVILGGGISNTWQTRDAIRQSALDNTGSLASDFQSVITDNRVIVNGLLGIGAEVDRHRFRLTNLYIHDTLKQTILGRGSTENSGPPVNGIFPFIDQNTSWFERELKLTQGVAELDFDRLQVDLRGSFANTRRLSPYERFFRYQYSSNVRDYINDLGNQTPATIAFSELIEDLWSGSIDVSYELNTERPLTLSAGYAYSDADRTSSRFQFRYVGPNNTPIGDLRGQLRPDFLVSDFNIQNGTGDPRDDIFLLNESTAQGAAAYDAELTTHAGYVQAEGEVLDGLRATIGVRYETADQTVTPFGIAAATSLSNDYWLPASTITWNFANDMQLRAHFSKTIARPQFRELAPQIYQDFETNRQFFGNPFLVDSELYNLEARYEWFFAREQRLTLAGFYKRIDNPIEAVGFVASGGASLQSGFSNAPSATLYGAELELQKYFPLDFIDSELFATKRLLLIGNYTYSKSEISAGSELVSSPFVGSAPVQARQLFRDGGSLVGQSDHLVNAQIGIEDTESLSQVTLLFNYASERVSLRGPVIDGVRSPDIVERPGVRFDVVYRQGVQVGEVEFELKFEARNLTETRYQEFQEFENGRVNTNVWDLGRIFTIGLSAKL